MTLGLHPAQLHALAFFLQGSAGLIIGIAFAISGLLGLADGYETIAVQLRQLLGTKQISEELELPVRSDADLAQQSSSFWQAYRSAAIAIGLFMIGILGLSIALSGADFTSYQIGLGFGLSLFGLLAIVLCVRSVGCLRRTHRSAATSIQLLDQQPEISFERPASLTKRPAAAWNRRRKRTYPRSLDPSRRQRTASATY